MIAPALTLALLLALTLTLLPASASASSAAKTLRAAGANLTDRAAADAALAHTFTLQGVTATQPRRAGDAGYDWDWRGPRDDPEWSWFFNRHDWFPALLAAYRETEDPRYAAALLSTLDDWILTHPAPGRLTFSASWRPLEAARRLLHSWLPIAPDLHALPGMTPECLARFEASLVAHGEHLRAHHAFGGNHLVTEMLALTRLALARPDLPGSDRWLAYGLDQLARAYDEQIYPDGAHVELSTHYQRVIALNYQALLDQLRQAGRADLVAAWTPRVERLWRYVAAVMTPAGANPQNNDSDREDYRGLLATHAPALLVAPAATTHFPWAGQTVWRGGPDAAPHWAFFEAGPRGTDHDHADHLQLVLALGATEFLVDAGRYTYVPGPWRDTFAGPAAHNVLLLDSHGADPQPRRVSAPPAPTRFRESGPFAWAWGDATFSTPEKARAGDWRRIVIYARDAGWVVVDRVIAFGSRTLTTQWHWAPDVAVEPVTTEPPSLASGASPNASPDPWSARAAGTTLEIIAPADGIWSTTRGQETPAPRGWLSPLFNTREPATQTDFTQTLRGPRTNLWIFRPAAAEIELHVEALAAGHVRLRAGEHVLELDPEKPAAAR